MSIAMLTIIGRVYVARKIISMTQLNYSLLIHAPKVISVLTVPMVYSNVDQMESACLWATMVIALRVLIANLISIAIWENAQISKKLMTNVSIEMNAGDKQLASLKIPAQLPGFAQSI
jgi:hypothetical protein